MPDKLHVPEERALSLEEITLLEWLLAHGRSDAPQYRLQIPKLRVVSRCGCGCPTIDFAMGTTRKIGPSDVVADAQGRSPEGILVGVIVHICEDEISELEVYGVARENEPFSLPRPEALTPWSFPD